MTVILSAPSWCSADPALAFSLGVLLLSVAYVVGALGWAAWRLILRRMAEGVE